MAGFTPVEETERISMEPRERAKKVVMGVSHRVEECEGNGHDQMLVVFRNC